MKKDITYSIKTIRFDEDYSPSDGTRATTNFANRARGAGRRQNLRKAFDMMNNRFNALADWDNPDGDRYAVELEIISAVANIRDGIQSQDFLLIEILKPTILNQRNGRRIDGILGNNFSSYVRDYDFSILLPRHNKDRPQFSMPDNFGDLHGRLFKSFVASPAYKAAFAKPPVICLSVSCSRTYRRTDNRHPVLGVEYRQDEPSATDRYFGKMGLQVRFFMPPGSVAPLAFYFTGDLLDDYSNLELIGTISTMETFQKIYRPEIYNANAPAAQCFQPSLDHQDHSLTQIDYDRQERSRLAVEQGRFAEEKFIKPNRDILGQWSARHTA